MSGTARTPGAMTPTPGAATGTRTRALRRSTSSALLAAVCVFVASGCAPEPAPAPAIPDSRPAVVTDAGAYRFVPGGSGPELRIASTFTAPADVDVAIANCNGAFSWRLQQRVGDAWVDAWVPAMDACLSEPLSVPAGTAHAALHLVREGAGAALRPAADGTLLADGTYRLVWDGVSEASGGRVDPSKRTSAPFDVSSTAR